MGDRVAQETQPTPPPRPAAWPERLRAGGLRLVLLGAALYVAVLYVQKHPEVLEVFGPPRATSTARAPAATVTATPIVLPTATSDPPPPTAEPTPDTAWVAANSLYLRSGPGIEYEPVDVLYLCNEVIVVDRSQYWWQVWAYGLRGYVGSDYLSEERGGCP